MPALFRATGKQWPSLGLEVSPQQRVSGVSMTLCLCLLSFQNGPAFDATTVILEIQTVQLYVCLRGEVSQIKSLSSVLQILVRLKLSILDLDKRDVCIWDVPFQKLLMPICSGLSVITVIIKCQTHDSIDSIDNLFVYESRFIHSSDGWAEKLK